MWMWSRKLSLAEKAVKHCCDMHFLSVLDLRFCQTTHCKINLAMLNFLHSTSHCFFCYILVGFGLKQLCLTVASLAVLVKDNSHLFPDFSHDLWQQDRICQRHPWALIKSCKWREVLSKFWLMDRCYILISVTYVHIHNELQFMTRQEYKDCVNYY